MAVACFETPARQVSQVPEIHPWLGQVGRACMSSCRALVAPSDETLLSGKEPNIPAMLGIRSCLRHYIYETSTRHHLYLSHNTAEKFKTLGERHFQIHSSLRSPTERSLKKIPLPSQLSLRTLRVCREEITPVDQQNLLRTLKGSNIEMSGDLFVTPVTPLTFWESEHWREVHPSLNISKKEIRFLHLQASPNLEDSQKVTE